MTLDGMNRYLEDKGFEVNRERDSKRDCYVFTIRKPGYKVMTRDFKYPKSDDWKYKNEQMEKFLNMMVRDFYKGEEKQDMNTLKFEHPVFQTRGDAENTLDSLKHIIETYGCVTVADLYDYADMVTNYNDSRYGWTNLDKVSVINASYGYILSLPRPVDLGIECAKSNPNYNSYRKYASNDVESTKRVYRYQMQKTLPHIPAIENVIFNDPATIVFWADGTKTVVKCQEGYQFDPMAGLSMAVCEKAFGSKANSHKVFNKWLPKEDKDEPILYPEFKLENEKMAQAVEKIKGSFADFIDEVIAKKRGREEA